MGKTNADFTTLYQCVVCDEIFDEYTDLKNHETIHVEEENTEQGDDGDTFHQCVVCDEIFEQFCDLESHSRIHISVNDAEKKEVVDDGFFQCNLCGDKFKFKKSDLETHSNMHIEEELSRGSTLHECTVFKMGMDPFSDIALQICACKKQIETDNKEENLFKCDDCSKSFCRTVRLKKHQICYVYKCTVCQPNIDFEHFCDLEAHREIHGICLHNETFYQCNVCDEKFELYTDLEEHCKIHIEEERDDMDSKEESVDDRESAPIGGLEGEQNIQSYFDSEEHSYSVSSKYLSPEDIMHIGMLEHSYCKREGWHKCTLCRKKFEQYGELQRHWKDRICTGPEEVTPRFSHRCRFCGMCFKLNIDYRKHLKTHSSRSIKFKTHSSDVKKLPTNIQYVKWL